MRSLFVLMLAVLLLGIILTVLHVLMLHYGNVNLGKPDLRRVTPSAMYKDYSTLKRSLSGNESTTTSVREDIEKILKIYFQNWTKQEENHQSLRSQLNRHCNGFDEAIITKDNTPLGSKLTYDGDGRVINVTSEIFSTFAKEHPFLNKKLERCAVVGNGGILKNSNCGEAIDSAHFIIRCNMPPLNGNYTKDVGTKTDIVTANPSIVVEKYKRLLFDRRPFLKHLRMYQNATLLAPTFCYSHNTEVLLRAFETTKSHLSPVNPASMNPLYLKNLDQFWRSRGLDPAKRLTTGLMMTSLAIEICNIVDLYGFWPFYTHPHRHHPLTHHYFDDRPPKPGAHAMPAEFELLLKLHRQGVLRLHLGQCATHKLENALEERTYLVKIY